MHLLGDRRFCISLKLLPDTLWPRLPFWPVSHGLEDQCCNAVVPASLKKDCIRRRSVPCKPAFWLVPQAAAKKSYYGIFSGAQ
jgi:hypothetical protein